MRASKNKNQRESSYSYNKNTNERNCDNCRWKTLFSESQEFDCDRCQKAYVICDYCFDDYHDKKDQHSKLEDESDDSDSDKSVENEDKDAKKSEDSNEKPDKNKIHCIYCWSNKTLTDICVKSLHSFGFPPVKSGQTKIPISSLSKEKQKKLANLRVI